MIDIKVNFKGGGSFTEIQPAFSNDGQYVNSLILFINIKFIFLDSFMCLGKMWYGVTVQKLLNEYENLVV